MSSSPALKRTDRAFLGHLQHAWRQALRQRLDPALAVEREKIVFGMVCRCDPTLNGRYIDWLSRWRRKSWEMEGLQSPIRMADLSDLATALRHFDEIRPRLPPDLRAVGLYGSSEELYSADRLAPSSTEKSIAEDRRKRAREGSEVLYRSAGWRLLRLRTREAAAFWALGTRWCTSNGTAFDTYALRGDLFVLLTPGGKYQLHMASGEFRDAADGLADPASALRGAPSAIIDLLRIATVPRWSERLP